MKEIILIGGPNDGEVLANPSEKYPTEIRFMRPQPLVYKTYTLEEHPTPAYTTYRKGIRVRGGNKEVVYFWEGLKL